MKERWYGLEWRYLLSCEAQTHCFRDHQGNGGCYMKWWELCAHRWTRGRNLIMHASRQRVGMQRCTSQTSSQRHSGIIQAYFDFCLYFMTCIEGYENIYMRDSIIELKWWCALPHVVCFPDKINLKDGKDERCVMVGHIPVYMHIFHIYIYIYVCVCVYIYIYTYTHPHVHTHKRCTGSCQHACRVHISMWKAGLALIQGSNIKRNIMAQQYEATMSEYWLLFTRYLYICHPVLKGHGWLENICSRLLSCWLVYACK